jgi:hypothetical protein
LGTIRAAGPASDSTIRVAHFVLLAGCLLATLPVFASFLPIDIGVRPRIEPITLVLHLAAGLCALGLVIAFLQAHEETLHSLAHPMVLAALFVAVWSLLVAPLSDYPWMSLIGFPIMGESAIGYLSHAVFFASAMVLATNRRILRSLCMALVTAGVTAPVVMFVWGADFFVSLDLVGFFAIPAALGVWFLTDGRKPYLRVAFAVLAVLPAFALSANHSVIVVLTLAAAPAAAVSHWVLARRPDRGPTIRLLAILAVVVLPFLGLLLKWLLPEIIDLPSIRSRHLLDRVLFAALMDNPLIFAIGQGWGAINLTVDQFALSAGAVMWDGSWDLASRDVVHSHSTYVEALFGAGLPAFVGVTAMLAAALLVVKSERLPVAVFACVSLAGLGAVTGEFSSTAGAVSIAFGLVGVRADDCVLPRLFFVLGRAVALLMPVFATLLFVATFWQFQDSYTIRERIADVRAFGPQSAFACELHPNSAVYADTELSQGLIASYRPAFKLAAAGENVVTEDLRELDAYVCSANSRIEKSRSPTFLIGMESFRAAVALEESKSGLIERYRFVLENWPVKLVNALSAAPHRPDLAVGFFVRQLQLKNFDTVVSLAEALIERDESDPIALWFLGVVRIAAGGDSNRDDGFLFLRRALEADLQRLIPVPPDFIKRIRSYVPTKNMENG